MLEAFLTAAAVVLALAQPVPQLARVVRRGTVAGLSGSTTWLGFVMNVGWCAYGVVEGLLPVLVLSVAYVVGYGAVGVLLVRHGDRSGLLHALMAVVGGGLLVSTAGWAALATVLALAVGLQFLPQVRQAWRGGDLSGLAPGTYVVAAVDGVVWGAYGLAVGDGPLVLYGIVMCSVAALVLIPCRRWSRRVASLAGAPAG